MANDLVNHPAHYTQGRVEVIDFIEDQRLGFHLGNVVKYCCRSAHKGNEREDLEKARWYLDRHISQLKPSIAQPAATLLERAERAEAALATERRTNNAQLKEVQQVLAEEVERNRDYCKKTKLTIAAAVERALKAEAEVERLTALRQDV